jgi:isopenicillin N synthase-like dioxygenase
MGDRIKLTKRHVDWVLAHPTDRDVPHWDAPTSEVAAPQAAAQSRKPSQNEAYFVRCERASDNSDVIADRHFHGLNQWSRDLPGFRETALEYMRTLEALCRSTPWHSTCRAISSTNASSSRT